MTRAAIPVHTVVKAETAEDLASCMRIRKTVFVDEQGYDLAVEIKAATKADDAASTHFLLKLGSSEPIGTIRVIDSTGQLGRFAILKPHRGLGLGRPLVEAVHEHVRSSSGQQVWCQSQAGDSSAGEVDATGFYRRLGYVERGEKYLKEGTLHQDMVCSVIP
ncbi:hypothetical protein IAU60_000020 [Kwoniella sp. DSM 27419]